MTRRLAIVAAILLAVPFFAAPIIVQKVAAPAGGQAFYDDFNRASMGGDWTNHSAGDAGSIVTFSSTYAHYDSAVNFRLGLSTYTAGDTDTINQYCVIERIDSAASGSNGCVLRSSESNGDMYYIKFGEDPDTLQVERYTSYTSFVSSPRNQRCTIAPTLTWTTGTYMMATITGTGASTTVDVWVNVTVTSEDLSDPTTWGLPDYDDINITGTTDCDGTTEYITPVSNNDTNTGVGHAAYTTSGFRDWDNWYAGDWTP